MLQRQKEKNPNKETPLICISGIESFLQPQQLRELLKTKYDAKKEFDKSGKPPDYAARRFFHFYFYFYFYFIFIFIFI